jgi:hypothetical protein
MKKKELLSTIFISLACFLSMFGAQATATAACLEFGLAVQLNGNLIRQTFPGPPNYESVAKGDTPEVAWILHLDKPVCVKARPGDDIDVAISHLQDLQLVLADDGYYRQAKKFLTRKVMVTGVLFGAHTGHHHTPVLMDVKDMQVMEDKY